MHLWPACLFRYSGSGMKKYNIRLIKLFWSSRPISWINTAFPFATGFLFLRHTTVFEASIPVAFWVAIFFFLIPYNLLIYTVNDVFDYESDMRNPRKGGIEGAVLAKEFHPFMLGATAMVSIPFIYLLLEVGTRASNLILLFCVVNALAYSVPVIRLKERPVLDSISSSLHFVGPLLFAMAVTDKYAVAIPYAIAFFLWGMASHAFGAVQDIIPDRQAKLASIATRFGASNTVRLSLFLYIAAVILVALQGWPAVMVALVVLTYPAVIWPYRKVSDRKSASSNKAWKYFLKLNQLTGFTVTILLIVWLRA